MLQRFVCGFNSVGVAEFVRILLAVFDISSSEKNSYEFCYGLYSLSVPFEDGTPV